MKRADLLPFGYMYMYMGENVQNRNFQSTCSERGCIKFGQDYIIQEHGNISVSVLMTFDFCISVLHKFTFSNIISSKNIRQISTIVLVEKQLFKWLQLAYDDG